MLEADSVASSRMRTRMLLISPSDPSAVCSRLAACSVLRVLACSPARSARSPSRTDSPAASSAARLMRSPEDSRSSGSASARLLLLSWRAMLLAARLVLMRIGMSTHPAARYTVSLGKSAVRLNPRGQTSFFQGSEKISDSDARCGICHEDKHSRVPSLRNFHSHHIGGLVLVRLCPADSQFAKHPYFH